MKGFFRHDDVSSERTSKGGRALEDDRRLAARAPASAVALGELYDRYYDRVYRYTWRHLGSRAEAEDATAATFESMLQALPRYRPTNAPFAAWLFAIAARRVADTHRQRRGPPPPPAGRAPPPPGAPGGPPPPPAGGGGRAPPPTPPPTPPLPPWLSTSPPPRGPHPPGPRGRTAAALTDSAPTPAGDPVTTAEHQAELAALHAALSRLRPPDRRVIDLHFFAGLSHAEAAPLLGCTQAHVAVRLHRALQRLTTAFSQTGGDLSR